MMKIQDFTGVSTSRSFDEALKDVLSQVETFHGTLPGVDNLVVAEVVNTTFKFGGFANEDQLAVKVALAGNSDQAIGNLVSTEEQPNLELLTRQIGELIGLCIRTYTQGDATTDDFRSDRVNFVLSKEEKTIAKIYIG